MQGRPVWLASLSLRLRSTGLIRPAELWHKDTLKAAKEVVRRSLLKGIGDVSMERMFRMCMTLCFHRALTREEIEGLPPQFLANKPRDFAGGPLHTYYSRGVPKDLPTLVPCMKPRKTYLDMSLENYVVNDCGECRPCMARLALSQYIDLMEWPIPEETLYRKIEAYNKRLVRVKDIIIVET
jgi:hypothetical protein